MGLEKWCVKTSPEEGRSTLDRLKTLRTKRHMPHRAFAMASRRLLGVCVFVWIEGLAEPGNSDVGQ